ncbi:energy-coupling factor transporter transmembrane protein EcfT [Oscillatoria sp. FACHB-1407]|uniref:energy-coupling factor transporter transmembrane component T family protein n=1 Tax=Oscillatoria sp. FACHB-1407 TaxID=2692847 RepID=UPI001686E468|nr:energy-coupling factor transporter transmembrane protein EcfT [Oscillatoria sp. FACHB-1407]MBD2462962.1 energy-coupling factor transporter transmembrane protein EcfT [Oscillatoria sp. FACHB-1407]
MDLLRSLPIGLYLEQPVSWLHRLDPRVKLVWLLTFLLTPIAANPYWRLSLVGWLLLLTLTTLIPFRVWRNQMGLVILFSLLIFFATLLAPDGLNIGHQPRLPTDELLFSSPGTVQDTTSSINVQKPASLTDLLTSYHYVLFQQGFLRITRRSVELAVRISTLLFTLIYSTNLYLLTTAPEEITAGLDNLLQPLRRFKIPVTEIVLTLTLSLRFIPLVLEEVQNLVRSVRTRAINWKKLGLRGSTQVWLMVAERLLDNLLVRADQIASAMQVRGFTSPDQHQVKWHIFRLSRADGLALLGVLLFWSARFIWGGR